MTDVLFQSVIQAYSGKENIRVYFVTIAGFLALGLTTHVQGTVGKSVYSMSCVLSSS